MQVYNIILDHHHKETTQHGSLGFPLAIYHQDQPEHSKSYPLALARRASVLCGHGR